MASVDGGTPRTSSDSLRKSSGFDAVAGGRKPARFHCSAIKASIGLAAHDSPACGVFTGERRLKDQKDRSTFTSSLAAVGAERFRE